MTSWLATPELHTAFAAMSGDLNPIHTDPIAARRLHFGRAVVHGMHLTLQALEHVVAATGRTITGVDATFRHPVAIGDTVDIDVGEPVGDRVSCTVTIDVWDAATIDITLGEPTGHVSHHHPAPAHMGPGPTCSELGLGELVGLRGSIDVAADTDALAGGFPHLEATIGALRVAELCTLTRLIGMEAPGLHSLFSSFTVMFEPDVSDDRMQLEYTVRDVDDRFSRAVIDVRGPTMHGSAVAFVRTDPVDQSIDATQVVADEFDGRVLVVGGSRGLGAAAVRLCSAGGADVRFTYRVGRDDAAAVERAAPGAGSYHLDVTHPDDGIAGIVADGWAPTHLLYFATPPIFDGVGGRWSQQLHDRFTDIYLTGFERTVELLAPLGLRAALWPSSVAVDRPVAGLAEYADVKRRGEELCVELADRFEIAVEAPRLPRLLTDQTSSLVLADVDDTASTLLTALRTIIR